MSSWRFLRLVVAVFVVVNLYPSPLSASTPFLCQTQLIRPLGDSEDILLPQDFTLMIATPRLLIGTFSDTIMPNVSVVRRDNFSEVGKIGLHKHQGYVHLPIDFLRSARRGRSSVELLERGNGFSAEAKFALMSYYFFVEKTPAIYAVVDETNDISIHLHEKLGYQRIYQDIPAPIHMVASRSAPTRFYRITSSEFEKWHRELNRDQTLAEEFFLPSGFRLKRTFEVSVKDMNALRQILFAFKANVKLRLDDYPDIVGAIESNNSDETNRLFFAEARNLQLALFRIEANLRPGTTEKQRNQIRADAARHVGLLQFFYLLHELTKDSKGLSEEKALDIWAFVDNASRGSLPAQVNSPAAQTIQEEALKLKDLLVPSLRFVLSVQRVTSN